VQQVLEHYFNRNQGPVVPTPVQAGTAPAPAG